MKKIVAIEELEAELAAAHVLLEATGEAFVEARVRGEETATITAEAKAPKAG
jgi:hypothetical protein